MSMLIHIIALVILSAGWEVNVTDVGFFQSFIVSVIGYLMLTETPRIELAILKALEDK